MAVVRALRRYPVKSMGGESLDSVVLDARGIVGDRWYAVVDAEGRLASGKSTRRFRRYDEVFAYSAATSSDGVTVSRDGSSWSVGSALDAELSASFGVPVRVLPEAGTPHHDAVPLSLIGTATLAWGAERWGGSADPRRFRANVVLETEEPFEEEAWVGSLLEIGGAVLRVPERIPRCRMIDIDQDGVVAGDGWLKPLTVERGMCLAVAAEVERPGSIAVGDPCSSYS